MSIKVLDLFSGTHSLGKECHKRSWHVTSVDRDLPEYDKLDKDRKYKSDKHFQEDIMTWDYKQYEPGHFQIVCASPVCRFWSPLRYTWIGRKMKGMTENFTKEDLLKDIDKFGKPMVDRVRLIIDYFKPKYFWIENPKSSSMISYITDLPFVIVDYCKYASGELWGYQKRTRFWVSQSIKDQFKPKLCHKDCDNILINGTQKNKSISKIHKYTLGSWGKKGTGQKGIGSGSNRLARYRIPPNLISDLLDCMIFEDQDKIKLYNDDCFNILKNMPDKSVDIFISDLPYSSKNFGRCVACKWDNTIDLDKLWSEFKRIRKSKNTPFFFFCNVKHGYDLISSNKKGYRYPLIWIKSGATGFLCAKKMPLKKSEFIYVFYDKLPFYDLSSHKHKFIKSKNGMIGKDNLCYRKGIKQVQNKKYTPPLPSNVIDRGDGIIKGDNVYSDKPLYRSNGQVQYDPPLPNNVIDRGDGIIKGDNVYSDKPLYRSPAGLYDPKLPTNIIEEKTEMCKYENNVYMTKGRKKPIKISKKKMDHSIKYDPKLPTNIIEEKQKDIYGMNRVEYDKRPKNQRGSQYEPQLPNNVLRIKSQRGKHSTQKPVDIYKWILKYYSKKDWVCLDVTMGSGSCGVACKEMDRKFWGIEKDNKIFKIAQDRINKKISSLE